MFPMAENIRPSTEAGGTTRGKRMADEIEDREGGVGWTEWASWSLGIGREVEGFVVVVVGKGEHEISLLLSSLQLVSSPLFWTCGILVF